MSGPKGHFFCDDFPAQMECCVRHDPKHNFNHSELANSIPGVQAHMGNPGSTHISGDVFIQAHINNSILFF